MRVSEAKAICWNKVGYLDGVMLLAPLAWVQVQYIFLAVSYKKPLYLFYSYGCCIAYLGPGLMEKTSKFKHLPAQLLPTDNLHCDKASFI